MRRPGTPRRGSFPRLNIPTHNPHHGVMPHGQLAGPFRIAHSQLLLEQLALKFQLPESDAQQDSGPPQCNLGNIEIVTACPGLVGDAPKIGADRGYRLPASLKSLELGMEPVAGCLAEHSFLGEQAFAPQGKEPHAIE